MTVEEYFQRMKKLGYPRPSLELWVDKRGALTGSSSFEGTCGHGAPVGKPHLDQDDLVQTLFDSVTFGGRRFENLWDEPRLTK